MKNMLIKLLALLIVVAVYTLAICVPSLSLKYGIDMLLGVDSNFFGYMLIFLSIAMFHSVFLTRSKS